MEALVTQASPQAAAADAALGRRRGDELPAELARREERVGKIEAAMRRWEAQAKAAAEAERQRRADAEAERQRTGTPRRGQAPQPVVDAPADKAQRHWTDPELPLMRTHNTGWEDWGNAHVRVDGACQIIVACDVTEASNDTPQAEPGAQATLATLSPAGLEGPKDAWGTTQPIPATVDHGYDRETAVAAREPLGFAPSLAIGRQRPHALQRPVPETPATAQERMAATVRTPAGTALYARRKVIVEPVCGQSKEARGFRRWLLRGLDHLRGEWRLGCLTQNLLKMWRYGGVLRAVEAMWRPVYERARPLVRAP
jgi:hypothetical protein